MNKSGILPCKILRQAAVSYLSNSIKCTALHMCSLLPNKTIKDANNLLEPIGYNRCEELYESSTDSLVLCGHALERLTHYCGAPSTPLWQRTPNSDNTGLYSKTLWVFTMNISQGCREHESCHGGVCGPFIGHLCKSVTRFLTLMKTPSTCTRSPSNRST